MQRLLLLLVLLSAVPKPALGSWCHFWRGRRSTGNVGEPDQRPLDGGGLPLLEWPPEQFVNQPMDHFNVSNTALWKQRYFFNCSNYVPGGPVFVMLSGESTANRRWMSQGAWTHYAKDHKALLFQLEHRFYGKSRPTENLATDNLIKFLSSEQAIEDAASFIVQMKCKYQIPSTSKWIVFGASYGASLATWTRQRHPELVHAAVASSGPLWAKPDFWEYFQVVEASLRNGNCRAAIAEAFGEISMELLTHNGQQLLNEKLLLCDPVQTAVRSHYDLANLFENLAAQIAVVVQYNSSPALVDIEQVCSIMVNASWGSPLMRFAEVNLRVMDDLGAPCLDYKYDKMLEHIKRTSWDSDVAQGVRQWTFQTCNEFGFYQTPYSYIFGNRFSLPFYVKQCSDIFGSSFSAASLNRAVRRTNRIYGGLHPNTTNVFSVQGSVDPWHTVGLQLSPDRSMPTVILKGCSHCSDVYEPRESDDPQIKNVRSEINRWIGEIINDDEEVL